ncbi:hypothetical protein HHK36_005076 [Tetracentron sinense]|uniref:TCP domain-containing protein n=1 Tax=Tetracentron sinense TaxID=13715 RepID=A0A834ZNP2_TETSI|nr:hypothetical protein HHK36_005076 [Tetracentron sinense]
MKEKIKRRPIAGFPERIFWERQEQIQVSEWWQLQTKQNKEQQGQQEKWRKQRKSEENNNEYARFRERMDHQPSSRLGIRSAGGEIVQVQGGHIVRSTGRKDRHSKVCTAKGPRDRRVRLSAHTAIQFYDVQDRLGYDRPSKAVDWLIKKAKASIDELAELPAWHPTTLPEQAQEEEENQNHLRHHLQQQSVVDTVVGSSKRVMEAEPEASGYGFQHQQYLSNNPSNSSSFFPPSLDSDAIKSFFPIAAAATSSSSIHFQNYPPDLLSRTSSQNQDLRLSLQYFKDPVLLHRHSMPEQALFSGSTQLGFDATSGSWSEQQTPEMGRFQRMVGWNAGADTGGGGGGGFIFNSPPPPPPPQLQPLVGQYQLFSQRGPLQSSNSPSVRAWTDLPIATTDHHQIPLIHPSSISGIGFASRGFSGFRIPARIQGEEEHEAVSNKPSSASRH